MSVQRKNKSWEELDISDNFIFGKVIQNPEICKELLELILDIKIERIEYPSVEKSLKMTYDGKGIRLDVYVADGKNTVYNIEMQASNTGEIPERSRYYQGIIDMELIEKGAAYSELNRSFIIFICKFDMFQEGRYRYTFEQRCVEDTNIRLNDGATRIFLNTKGILENEEISDNMRAFLEYVEGNESDNVFVKKVTEEVEVVKRSRRLRGEYMNQVVRDHLNREEGRKEGHKEGTMLQLVTLVRAKVRRGKSLELIVDELIADELECKLEEVREIYEAVQACGVESALEEVMKVLGFHRE